MNQMWLTLFILESNPFHCINHDRSQPWAMESRFCKYRSLTPFFFDDWGQVRSSPSSRRRTSSPSRGSTWPLVTNPLVKPIAWEYVALSYQPLSQAHRVAVRQSIQSHHCSFQSQITSLLLLILYRIRASSCFSGAEFKGVRAASVYPELLQPSFSKWRKPWI